MPLMLSLRDHVIFASRLHAMSRTPLSLHTNATDTPLPFLRWLRPYYADIFEMMAYAAVCRDAADFFFFAASATR